MIPLLIVLLPLLAALLILIAGRPAPVSRRLAVGALAAQLLPVVAALIRFPLREAQGMIASGLDPAPAERLLIPLGTLDAGSVSFSLSFLFGLDAISLSFLLLVVVLFGAVLLLTPVLESSSRFHYPLLLLLNAFLCGALVSLDGLLTLLCVGGLLIGAVAVVCLPVSGKGIGAGRRFLPVACGGTMLLCVTLMAVSSKAEVVGAERQNRVRTFDLPAITDRVTGDFRANLTLLEGSREMPGSTSDTVLFALLLCFSSLLMVIVPLHPSIGDLAEASPPPLAPLLFLLFPLLGLFLLIRFPLSLFPGQVMNPFSHTVLAGAGGLTALYGGLVALGERKPARVLRYAALAWSGAALLLLAFLDAPGVGAGLSGFVLSALCVAGLYILNDWMEAAIGREYAGRITGLRRVLPRWSVLFGALSVLLSLLPFLIVWLLLRDSVEGVLPPELRRMTDTGWGGWMTSGAIGILFVSIALIKTAARLLFGSYPVALAPLRPPDLRSRTWGGSVVLLLAVAALSVPAVILLTEVAGIMVQRLVELTGSVPT